MSPLAQLAGAAGVAVRARDAFGTVHSVPPTTLRAVLAALGLPAETKAEVADSLAALRRPPALPPLVTAEAGQPVTLPSPAGRFRLQLESGETAAGMLARTASGATAPPVTEPGYHRLETPAGETILAVAPPRCFGLTDLAADEPPHGKRPWGLSVPLYGLRRPGDGGIGDYTALAAFVAAAAAQGAAAVAISPVHAPFAADPTRFSPYSPSSRALLNGLYADPQRLPFGLAMPDPGPDLAADLARLEARDLIDWPAAVAARLRRLRAAFAAFAAAPPEALGPARAAFAAFRAAQGRTLEHHARFEALHAHFLTQDPSCRHWRDWPPSYRDPASPHVAAFAHAHADEVAFHAFLQFLADAGLGAAQATARNAGMKIGLMTDLAVGTDSGGSQAWAWQAEMLVGLSVGAPPDPLSHGGQDWGLASLSPAGLRANGFAGFIEMLRAALRHAGGVRIDHVMGLRRLWVIPEGAAPTEGAYLAYPETDLLRLVALESWRHRAIVLGEDLGTVPPGFRAGLRRAGLMGLSVLMFERNTTGFIPPKRWRQDAVAMTSTHDLPTVSGWWQERDIDWRARLGLIDPAAARRQRAERATDRAALWTAFGASGAASGPPPAATGGVAAADAACAHLGAAASGLALLPVEDALALDEQPNLPGTIDAHPNWCRRLPAAADAVLEPPAVRRRLAALDARRTRR